MASTNWFSENTANIHEVRKQKLSWQHATKGPGNKFMLTPAETEALQRLRPMLAAAVSKATKDEEHAVSEVTPGKSLDLKGQGVGDGEKWSNIFLITSMSNAASRSLPLSLIKSNLK